LKNYKKYEEISDWIERTIEFFYQIEGNGTITNWKLRNLKMEIGLILDPLDWYGNGCALTEKWFRD
jgi:hypothetical protein